MFLYPIIPQIYALIIKPPHFFPSLPAIPCYNIHMNSLSAIKEAPIQPEQLEFNFEGYDEEPLSEKSFATAETLTLNAITGASTFTDLFEDARCISRIYGNCELALGYCFIFTGNIRIQPKMNNCGENTCGIHQKDRKPLSC